FLARRSREAVRHFGLQRSFGLGVGGDDRRGAFHAVAGAYERIGCWWKSTELPRCAEGETHGRRALGSSALRCQRIHVKALTELNHRRSECDRAGASGGVGRVAWFSR